MKQTLLWEMSWAEKKKPLVCPFQWCADANAKWLYGINWIMLTCMNLTILWLAHNINCGMLISLLYKEDDCWHCCYWAHGNHLLVCNYMGTLYIPFSFVPSARAPWCLSSACLVHSFEQKEAENRRKINDYNEGFQHVYCQKALLKRKNHRV